MIIPFPQAPRVVISCALITKTTRHTGQGTFVVRHDPPMRRYFLDYEDCDGCCGVWDGPSYAAALEAAREWVTDGVFIRDRTHETWGRT